MAIALQNLITRIGDLLADEEFESWDRYFIARSINEAAREIINYVPTANEKRLAYETVPESHQVLPCDAIRLIDVEGVFGPGCQVVSSISRITVDELDSWDRGWRGGPKGIPEFYTFDELKPTHFWLYPPPKADVVVGLVYSVYPPPIVEFSDFLDMHEYWENRIIDYVMFKAFQVERVNSVKEQAYQQAFYAAIGAQDKVPLTIQARGDAE